MNDKKKLNEKIKELIKQGFLLSGDKKGNGYVCPVCGNGTGNKGDGLHFKKDSDLLYCFSCGKNFDPLEILKIVRNKKNFNETKEEANFLFRGDNIEKIVRNASLSEDNRFRYGDYCLIQNKARNAIKTQIKDYCKQCSAQNDGSVLKKRGISLKTQKKFNIGIDNNWINPLSVKEPKSARIIIPTSNESYVARKIGEISEKFDDRIRKVGKNHFFNEETLSNASDNRPCFVVEGEIDALSLEEIGKRAIGLGGLSSIGKFVEKIDNRQNLPTFILTLDNDKRGLNAQNDEKGLNAQLTERGIFAICADYTGEKWTRAEHPLKDVNDFLVESRTDFEIWASQQEIKALSMQRECQSEYKQFSLQSIEELETTLQKQSCISTGFLALDRLLDGGFRTGLITIGAGTSLGKTSLAMQIAENIARKNYDVLFFSLEMGTSELIARSLSRISAEQDESGAISYSEVLQTIQCRDCQYERFSATKEIYRSYCEHIRIIEPGKGFSIDSIRNDVLKHKRITGHTPVIFIDYLQILHPSEYCGTEKQQIDNNIFELRKLSKDLDTIVVVISSLNRTGYKKRPTLESFKESGGVEYGSDVVLMLSFNIKDNYFTEIIDEETGRKRKVFDYNLAKRENPRDMKLSLLKNRNGIATGEISLAFYAKYSLFVEP